MHQPIRAWTGWNEQVKLMEYVAPDNPIQSAWQYIRLHPQHAVRGLAAAAAYCLVFLALVPFLGAHTSLLALVPVLAAGLYFGLWAGLAACGAVVALNLALLQLAGRPFSASWSDPEWIFGLLALVTIGAITGRTRDIRQRLARELAARQQAEADREATEGRYRTLFQSVPVGLYRTTPEGRILDASPALVEMLGYPDLETLKKVAATDLFVQQDQRLQQREFMNPDGVVHGCEVELRCFDGRLIWVQDNFRAISDEEGKIRFFDGSLEDITARKEMEAALRESRQRFYVSLETMLDGFAILTAVRDPDGRIVDFTIEYINEAGCRLIGIRGSVPEAISLQGLLPPGDPLDILPGYIQVVESGTPFARDALTLAFEFREEDDPSHGPPPGGSSFRAIDLRATKLGDGVAMTWRDVSARQAMERAERDQRILAQALRDTAAALGSTLEYEAVLDCILLNVGKVVPHDAANIMLLDGEAARLERSQGYIDSWQAEDRQTSRFPLSEMPTLSQMFESGEPLSIPDTHNSPGWVVTPHSEWMRSYAGAPIRLRGVILGFLNLNSATVGFFTQEKAERLQAFADQAAVAIENARYFGELQAFARQMALLNDITRASISAPDLRIMLNRLADRLGELISADGAYITLWDAVHGKPVPAAAYGPHQQNFPELAVFPGETNITSSVLQAGTAVAVENPQNSPYISSRLAQHYSLGSLLGLPMIVDGKPLGAVIFAFEQRHAFSQAEIAIGEQAAAQIALAISKAQLYESERARTQELARANQMITALGQIATQVSSATDQDQVVEILGYELKRLQLNCLVALKSAETASISVHYPPYGADVFALAKHLAGGNHQPQLLSPEQLPYKVEVIDERQAIHSEDLSCIPGTAFPGLAAELYGPVGEIMGAVEGSLGLFLPLATGENVLGALWMWGFDLSRNDLPAASLFASQVTVALENARLYQRIQDLAIKDELTGLYNRRGLLDIGRREAERAKRHGHPLCALLIDIDHFKQINDTYGHTIGDQVLRAFAECCRKNVREVDVVGRIGGEEFIILLPETDSASSHKVAERLRKRILKTGFKTRAGDVHLTVSIGLATYAQEDPDLDMLYRQADEALYLAKKAGRNRVAAVYEAALPAGVSK
jgi:diguanylate cyclase (GGDEF)-like protein/PAS domain S-box-containing protein